MRNLKRYLALAVAITMMFTLMVPVATAVSVTDSSTAATVLYDLGLYKGISEDSFNPDLDSTLNRETAVTMLLRLTGVEEYALDMTSEEADEALAKFTDAMNIAAWAKKQVAYAVENDVVKGFQNGTTFTFQPKGLLTTNQWSTLILKQLGYEVAEFSKASEQFATTSMATSEEKSAFGSPDGVMNKGQLVRMSYKALSTEISEFGTTLIEELVYAGNVDQDAAVDAGFTFETVEPTVEPTVAPTVAPESIASVTATNGTLTVVMSEAPEATPVADDFAVVEKVEGAADVSVTATVYSYDAATKTAVLNFTPVATATVDQTVTFAVAYKDGTAVVSNAVTVVAGFALNSIMAYNTISTNELTDLVESGATIKAQFSAAVDSTTVNSTNFSMKTGTTNVACDVTLSTDKKTVSIKPVTALTVNGEYTLTIAAAVKADGEDSTLGTDVVKTFTVSDSLSLISLKNAGGTVIDSYDTAGTNIVLTFNKDISQVSMNTESIKVYNETDMVYLPLNSSHLTLTSSKVITVAVSSLTSNYLVNKKYTIKINGLKSLDGKELSGYTKSYGYAAQVNQAPTMTTIPTGFTGNYNGIDSKMLPYTAATGSAPNGTLSLASPIKATVQFGRAMDEATLTSDNFYIAEVDDLGLEVANTKVAGTVTYDPASYTATFMPTSALKEKQDYGAIITEDVMDANGVPSEEQLTAFTTDDFTPPTVTSTSVDSGARIEYDEDIVIHFSEKMAAAQFALVADASGEADFTATTSVKVYNQTDNYTIDGTAGAYASGLNDTGLALTTTYLADATDPRLEISAPTAGWGINKTYKIVLNGYVAGETTMSLSDALVSGTKTHGNMLADDKTITFTTVAESLPTVTAVKVIKVTDGPLATSAETELSRTSMTYNVQNAGTAGANNIMKITFSKNMAIGNLADGDLEFWFDDGVGGGTADDGIFNSAEKYPIPAAQLSVSSKTVTWTPAGSLLTKLTTAGDHEGRLVIKYDTTDESGQDVGTSDSADLAYQFTTGAGPAYSAPTDATATVKPAKFATGFVKSEVIEVRFDQTIDDATIGYVEIRKETADGEVVDGTWYNDYAATTPVSGDQAAYFFEPSSDLVANTKYYVFVPGTVTDLRGNPAVPYTYYFTTLDDAAPTATFTMPTNYNDPIVVTFDKAMDTSGNDATDPDQAAAYTLLVNGAAITTFTVSYDSDDNEAEIYTDTPLADGDVVQIKVNAGVLASNAKAVPANITSAEAVVANSSNVTTYRIKTATYDTSSKILTMVLDRPATINNTDVVAPIPVTTLDFASVTFSNGTVVAANLVAASISDKTVTYVLKDSGTDDVGLAPGVSKVALTSDFTFTTSTGTGNFGTNAKTMTSGT